VVFVPFPSAGRRLFGFRADAKAPPLQRLGLAATEVHALPNRDAAVSTANETSRETSADVPALPLAWRRLSLFMFRTALYVIVAAVVLNTFMNQWGFRARSPRYGFKALITYSAHRPFAFRALAPAIINGVTALLPASRLEQLVEWDLTRPQADHPSLSAHRRFGWGGRPMPEQYVAYLVLWAVAFLLLVATRRLTRLAMDYPDAFVDWAPVVALLVLPLSFSRGGYLYDFPELLLVTTAIGLLLERRWLLYYACFTLACLNKETAILLVVYCLALHWKRLSRGRLLAHAGAHAMLGLPILAWQRFTFAANPGANAEFQLWDNLRFLLSPASWARFWDPYGPLLPFPGPFNVVSLVLFGAAVLLFWREKPHRLRVAFVAMMSVLVPLLIVYGTLDEVRNLSLVFPVAYLLACHTTARLYGIPLARPDYEP
jgi:hypothetical protein